MRMPIRIKDSSRLKKILTGFLTKTILACFVFLFLDAAFLVFGETFFRLKYFGPDSIRNFFSYAPADLDSGESGVRLDGQTYTGLKPDQNARLKGREIRINQLGFRGPDRAFMKGERVKRVVVIGSTVTIGEGVSDDQTYPGQLEKMLNAADLTHTYEVINLARCGAGIVQMIDTLARYGVRFNPDLIVIEFAGWYRFKPVITRPDAGQGGRRLPPRLQYFFIQLLEKTWLPALRTKRDLFLRLLRKKEAEPAGPAALPVAAMSQEEIRDYFNKISTVARGRPVIFMVLRPMAEFEKNYFSDDFFRTLCREYRFGLIDTYSKDFGRDPGKMRIYPGDESPNARAHQIYADAIFEVIKPRRRPGAQASVPALQPEGTLPPAEIVPNLPA